MQDLIFWGTDQLKRIKTVFEEDQQFLVEHLFTDSIVYLASLNWTDYREINPDLYRLKPIKSAVDLFLKADAKNIHILQKQLYSCIANIVWDEHNELSGRFELNN